MRSRRAGAHGAPPRKPTRSDDRSHRPGSLSTRSASIVAIVGTACSTVQRCRSIASSTLSERNRRIDTQSVPVARARTAPLLSPAACESGSGEAMVSAARSPADRAVHCALRTRLRALSATILAGPVEPEVNWMFSTASASPMGSGAASAQPGSPASAARPPSSVSVWMPSGACGRPASAAAASAGAARSRIRSATNNRRGRERATASASSAPVRPGCSVTSAAPRQAAAANRVSQARLFSAHTAIRSPGPTP